MKTKTKTDAELRVICNSLLGHEIGARAMSLSLGEFKRLYAIVVNECDRRVPQTSLVSLGREVFAQFSDISPQHFLLSDKAPLGPDDFDFVINQQWYGPRTKLPNFGKFLMSEIALNKWVLLLTFVASVSLMLLAHDNVVYDIVSGLLLQAATVFLSIYLIFTVTQNQILQTDEKLFEQGLLQQFHSDDRNLTSLALITIGLALFNTLITHLLLAYKPIFSVGPVTIDHHLFLAITTALGICLLFDTFLAVVNYYLERVRGVMEKNLISKIMHRDFERHHDHKDTD